MKRIVTVLLIAAVLTSCKTSQTVYRCGNGWNTMPTTSAMTGMNYKK